MKLEQFDELLSSATDETIKQIFGKPGSELIYGLMEVHVGLKRKEISKKIEAFYAYLKELLGSDGAETIQTASFKLLRLKLQREYEEIEKHLSLLDELYEVKFRLLAPLLEKQESSVSN